MKDYDNCECGKRKKGSSKQCKFCYRIENGNRTLESFIYNHHNNAASKYCRLRENARAVAQRCGMYECGCQNCGYKKHVEICHIKDIKDFDNLSTIREINDPNNLIPLCRNCHWEFDKDILKLDLTKRPNLIDPYYLEEYCSAKSYKCECGEFISRNAKQCRKCHLKVKQQEHKKYDRNKETGQFISKRKKQCKDCNNLIVYGAKRCKICYAKQNEKITWPPTKELKQMINESNYVQVGKKLGVSDNAVRKRIKNYPE